MFIKNKILINSGFDVKLLKQLGSSDTLNKLNIVTDAYGNVALKHAIRTKGMLTTTLTNIPVIGGENPLDIVNKQLDLVNNDSDCCIWVKGWSENIAKNYKNAKLRNEVYTGMKYKDFDKKTCNLNLMQKLECNPRENKPHEEVYIKLLKPSTGVTTKNCVYAAGTWSTKSHRGEGKLIITSQTSAGTVIKNSNMRIEAHSDANWDREIKLLFPTTNESIKILNFFTPLCMEGVITGSNQNSAEVLDKASAWTNRVLITALQDWNSGVTGELKPTDFYTGHIKSRKELLEGCIKYNVKPWVVENLATPIILGTYDHTYLADHSDTIQGRAQNHHNIEYIVRSQNSTTSVIFTAD